MLGTRSAVLTALAGLALSVGLPPVARAAVEPASTRTTAIGSYLVVARSVSALPAARAAIAASGGTVVETDPVLGVLTVTSDRTDFAAVADTEPALLGVARNRVIGALPKPDAAGADLRGGSGGGFGGDGSSGPVGLPTARPAPAPAEPLAGLQWDMKAIGATTTGSYARQQGTASVLVGVLDSGIDGTHPDIKPNFDAALSRNFVTDVPALDGPCEHPSCMDPVNEDDFGHGTHVAGTIAAPINGIGIAGVAPKVRLVNLRVGQDSGFIFVQPVIKALRYAADVGIDVVNMSFFIDPWLYNCSANPADSVTEQAEQRSIIEATQRALSYAHGKGVTLVAALGNEHADLGHVNTDAASPDYPQGTLRPRTIGTSSCLSMPAQGSYVIGVSSVGRSGKKADYSNHGLQQNDLAAPGGFYRDYAGTADFKTAGNLVLAPMPHNVALSSAAVDAATGASTDPYVISSCSAPGPANCAYWQYLQGTSMAAPHVAGVAALIISQYGHSSAGRIGLLPAQVEQIMERTATHLACPGPVITYTAEARGADYSAPCIGTAERNSIYGNGVVNALAAVTAGG
jgi:subtilisin family serine protease